MEEGSVHKVISFSLVICRNTFKESPHYGKWLAVLETMGKGWWLPGGGVDAGESFTQAAKRETIEEAGMEVECKGWLQVVQYPPSKRERLRKVRCFIYAEPVSLEAANNPKNYVNRESEKAEWKTLAQLELLGRKKMLRGPELLEWARYLEQGGHIYPLSLLGEENQKPKSATSASFDITNTP